MYLTKNLNKVLFFAVVMLIKLLFYNNADSLVIYPEISVHCGFNEHNEKQKKTD